MQTINKRAPGRRKKVFFNKGRQVDKKALLEAQELLNTFFPLKNSFPQYGQYTLLLKGTFK